MKRLLIKVLIWFLAVLFILSASGFFLLNTRQGLNFCFTAISKIVSGKLTVNNLDGRVLGPIDAEKIYFENGDLILSANKIHFEWKIRKFVSKIRPLFVVHANDLKIKIKKSGSEEEKLDIRKTISKIKRLFLPALLSLEDVDLQNISLDLGDSKPAKFSKIVLVASAADGENIDSLKFELDSDPVKILVGGMLSGNYDLNWQIDLSDFGLFFKGMEGSLSSTGKISGEFSGPEISATVKTTKFKYDDFSFARLESDIYVDWTAKRKSTFKLNIDLPKIDSLHFNRLNFAGDISPVKFKEAFAFAMNIDSTTMFFPVGEKRQSLLVERGVIDGKLNDKGLSLRSVLSLKNSNPINVDLRFSSLTSLESLLHELPIEGKATWQTDKLSFLQTVIPNIENVRGVLDVEYKIFGTAQNPKTEGDLKLYNAGLRIPGLNINLKNIKLNAKNVYNKVDYEGVLSGDEGSINVSGGVSYSNGIFNGNANVSGDSFLVINTKEYRVFVSPKLVLNFNDDLLDLTGELVVPKGVISPAEFSRDESLPAEIVYINDEKKQDAKELNMRSEINVKLGDDVSVDIMGLKGKVVGKVKINDEPKKVTMAMGDLYIKDGRYDIYGQKLKIKKGSLHFLGGPVTNPEVNIEAVRDFSATNVPASMKSPDQELIVGVKMAGMLNNPKIYLFSVPGGLSSSDILSYLIIGKPSDQASGSSAQLLLTAATALNFGGSSQMGGVIGDLRDKLGFSDFGFVEETSFAGSEKTLRSKKDEKPGSSLGARTSFVLGRFLTPKIYASYSMGLVDEANVFRVKYYINKYFSIQSETSISGSNAVDFFYTIEH